MKKLKFLEVIFVSLLAIASSYTFAQQDLPYQYNGSCVQKIKIDRPSVLAPEIKAGDLACIEYSPKAYQQGQGVTGATVVIVSATWCGPCNELKKHYSELLEVTEKHKASVKVILIDATPEQLNSYAPSEFFVSHFDENFSYVFGEVKYVPHIVILNNKGKVVETVEGNSAKDRISNIESALENL